MMYLWGNGAEIYDKDEKKVVICSQQAVDGLQMLLDLVVKDRVAAPEPENTDAAKARGDVLQQEDRHPQRLQLQHRRGGQAPAGGLRPGPLPVHVPAPHAPGKKAAAFVAIQSFLVFKQDKDKDRTTGAMQFGNHLTDTPAQEQIKSIGELPVRKSAGNIYAEDINRTTGFSVIENGRSMGRFPENGDIRVLWQGAVQQVWKREKSPKEALDEMCRLSEPIMAKSQAPK